MYVLCACEESQEVCKAFRYNGHFAFSCDIVSCSGGHPEWHIKQDVLPLLNGFCSFSTCDGSLHFLNHRWDMIIAFPPCTYLSFAGNRWFNTERYGSAAVERLEQRKLAIDFFMRFVNADCDKICIENPLGVMSTVYRPPDQIIYPYYFGDPFSKRTCLWLKGLQPLTPTCFCREYDSTWYSDLFSLPSDERRRLRSKTFPGVASAMANQFPFTYTLIQVFFMNCITYHVLFDSSLVAFGLEDKLLASEIANSWLRCFPDSDVKVIESNSIGGFSFDCF